VPHEAEFCLRARDVIVKPNPECYINSMFTLSPFLELVSIRLRPLLLRFFEHLLHDLLLLDQERTNDAVLDAVGASGATIGTLYGLLRAGDLCVFTGSESGNL
jgi:hypothetical protein